MRLSVGWTVEDNVVSGLFYCTTFKSSRRGHIPFVQAGTETSNTGAEAVKSYPHFCWQSHSGRVGADVVVKVRSTEHRSVLQPLRMQSWVIRPKHRTSVVVVAR